MKKPIKISITILLAFTMVFTNLFSSVPEGLIKDLFGNTATEVQAASKDAEKHATGHIQTLTWEKQRLKFWDIVLQHHSESSTCMMPV